MTSAKMILIRGKKLTMKIMEVGRMYLRKQGHEDLGEGHNHPHFPHLVVL
jgi:hypothetical protein